MAFLNDIDLLKGRWLAAAAMALKGPYLKSYVKGFLFKRIDVNTPTLQLRCLFDHDPELNVVLKDIGRLMHQFMSRYEVILPDGSIFMDFTGRRGADFVETDNKDDSIGNNERGADFVEDDKENDVAVTNDPSFEAALNAQFQAQFHKMMETLKEFQELIDKFWDKELEDESMQLAMALNAGIRRLMIAKIVPLISLLRDEILEQTRRAGTKKRRCAQ